MDNKYNRQPKFNLLISYPYVDDNALKVLKTFNNDRLRLVYDSGAFKAWKSGKPINIDDYCKFIETVPCKPWRYFTLDVIGDEGATLKNYEIMLRRGFNPVPIFTRGADISHVDEYYKTSDVIGIGGLTHVRRNKKYVNMIMKVVAGRKVHLLGYTNMDYIKFYRPYMCDASSWESGSRFGQLKLYLGKGKFETITRKTFIKRPAPGICRAIKRMGFKVSDFSIESNWHGGKGLMRQLCIKNIMFTARDIEKFLGTKLFVATTANDSFSIIRDMHNELY